MREDHVYGNYLRDLGQLISEAARSAKRERDELNDSSRRDYAIGRLMGYHEVVSLMLQQARAFGIDADDLGLVGLDPERDLI
jgi:hypothetical protein